MIGNDFLFCIVVLIATGVTVLSIATYDHADEDNNIYCDNACALPGVYCVANNASRFTQCESANARRIVKACPSETAFDPNVGMCTWPDTPRPYCPCSHVEEDTPFMPIEAFSTEGEEATTGFIKWTVESTTSTSITTDELLPTEEGENEITDATTASLFAEMQLAATTTAMPIDQKHVGEASPGLLPVTVKVLADVSNKASSPLYSTLLFCWYFFTKLWMP